MPASVRVLRRWAPADMRLVPILLAALLTLGFARAASAKMMFDDSCAPDAATNFILLDVTTKYDDIDRQVLTTSLGKILDTVAGGDRLYIATIEDRFSHSRRLIEACVPYCPPLSVLQQMFSSCTEGALAQKRKELATTLRAALTNVLDSSSELPTSDILRTLYYNIGELEGGAAKLNLFVFSDMLENSDLLTTRTFFSLKPATFVRRVKAANVLPAMPGANVRVFGVGRSYKADRPDLSAPEMAKLDALWQQYFEAAGATRVTLLPLLKL